MTWTSSLMVSQNHALLLLLGAAVLPGPSMRTLVVSAAAYAAHRANLVCRVARTNRGVAVKLLCCVRRATREGATRGCERVMWTISIVFSVVSGC